MVSANDPQGVANLDPRGLIDRIYVGDHIFLRFSHYKSMGVNDPQGVANLDPRGLIGRIYVRDH